LLSAHVTAAAAELPTRVDLDGHSYDLSTVSSLCLSPLSDRR
jgi:hypothetical protein